MSNWLPSTSRTTPMPIRRGADDVLRRDNATTSDLRRSLASLSKPRWLRETATTLTCFFVPGRDTSALKLLVSHPEVTLFNRGQIGTPL